MHTHSRTMNNRWLMEFHGENELWININKARALGIGDGDIVTVENEYGKARARAKVTRRIHTDVVGMVHGFGQRSKSLRRARDRGASDTQLMTRVKVDPLMGGTGMRVNFVRPVKEA